MLLTIGGHRTQIGCQAFQTFLERFAHHLDLAADQSKIGVLLADEAEDETEDWLGDVQCLIVLNEYSLELIVVKCFLAEFDVLVADVGKDCRLRMEVIILSSLGDDAALDVAE